MRRLTYHLLRQAHLGNVKKDALFSVPDSDPFIRHTIGLLTDSASYYVPWDTLPFTTEFRSVPARQRLDETVITFLLRIVAIVKSEMYHRAFRKPESWSAILAWIDLLKQCTFTILTLAYNLRWTTHHVLQLDVVVLDLIRTGSSTPLRQLMQQRLGISLSPAEFPAEVAMEKMHRIGIRDIGSSFWRLLHWMAEAVQVQENHPDTTLAKASWRRLVTGPLYRLLGCPICMVHLKYMVKEIETQLLDETIDFPRIWFNIHNRVTQKKMNSIYSEEEYEEDSSFMRQALLAPK